MGQNYPSNVVFILQKLITLSTTITGEDGEEYYLSEVIAFILRAIKERVQKEFKNWGPDFEIYKFEWVITVPAIWSIQARSRDMMRQAAYLVSLLY